MISGSSSAPHSGPVRLLSFVEANTVTGPVKPLLMFSSLVRQGFHAWPPIRHRMVTTRRPALYRQPQDALRTAAEAAGIEFVTLLERTLADPAVMSGMLKQIREFTPDLLETHDSKSHFLLLLLRLRHRALRDLPWIAFHHGYTRTSWKVRVYQQLDRFSLPTATHVNTLCKPFAADLIQRGVRPENISVLTNAVATRPRPESDSTKRLRNQMGIAENELLVLTVGRLSQEKGHADLIRAAATCTAPLRIVIAGDGPERDELVRLAGSLGDRVIFLGHVSDPWPLYNAADLFILPSHSEGSPLVIFEAMAASLPIIATAVGGVPEVLSHTTTALLVEPGDVSEFGRCLQTLATDPTLRQSLGTAANNELQNHSPSAYAQRLLAIYAAALSPARSS